MQKVLLDSVTFALEKIIHSLLIFLRIDSDGLTEIIFYSLHFIRQHVENCLIYCDAPWALCTVLEKIL